MSLPRPPKELAAFENTGILHAALNDMVQAYGQQCREAALEEAAIDAERFGHLWSGAPARSFFELAEKLRSMKRQTQAERRLSKAYASNHQ